jgi:hypothetical protein
MSAREAPFVLTRLACDRNLAYTFFACPASVFFSITHLVLLTSRQDVFSCKRSNPFLT